MLDSLIGYRNLKRVARYKGTQEQYESELKRLEKERTMALRKQEVKEKKQEIREIAHPEYKEVTKSAMRGIRRGAMFLGTLAKEGARSYSKTKETMKRAKGTVAARRSFVSPDGNDISLSSAIARNQWSDSNLMDTDFFGSGPGSLDMLGSSNKDNELIGDKKNQELI